MLIIQVRAKDARMVPWGQVLSQLPVRPRIAVTHLVKV
jgi:hypothetical protein